MRWWWKSHDVVVHHDNASKEWIWSEKIGLRSFHPSNASLFTSCHPFMNSCPLAISSPLPSSLYLPHAAARQEEKKKHVVYNIWTSITSNGGFPESIEMEIRRLCVDKCWNCLSEPIDVCHVFAKEDRQAPCMYGKSIVSFFTEYNNQLAYLHFLRNPTPKSRASSGLWSRLDSQRHRSLSTSASMYHSHQESLDSPAGLYRRVFLRDFIPYLPESIRNELKPWHGNPMASVRRGILATGSMRIDRFPNETFEQLRILQRLCKA